MSSRSLRTLQSMGFVMTVGSRRIRAIIRERREAERIYESAKAHGHTASLLTQDRPNIFTQQVANIEPGQAIDIDITYFHTLSYDDGWYEYVFPMVVGPRYNPPSTDQGIGAVSRGGSSGQRRNVHYQTPQERSGHDVAVTVDIDAGVTIEDVRSVNHQVDIAHRGPNVRQVTLKPYDSVPNKDFVLRYRVAGDEVKQGFLVHQDGRGGWFSFMLYPPAKLDRRSRQPLELIFVIDTSGSMKGRPLEQARRAVRTALDQLGPDDTFQIIRFAGNASQLGRQPIRATAANLRKGRRYLDRLSSGGGTEMLQGIRAALDFEHDPGRLRFVSFMTDGFIGNEQDVIAAIDDRLGTGASPTRIFSFGVGASPNRYLMSRMAKTGRGAVAYLSLNDHAGDVMSRFFDRIRHPVMTDITINWGNMYVNGVTPARIPDLFVGRPVVITGRFEGNPYGSITVEGHTAAGIAQATFDIDAHSDHHHPGLPAVWARAQISELVDRATLRRGGNVEHAITTIALDHGLLSAFTGFVAVDSASRTEGTYGVTVPVAVPVPDGTRYDTTVGSSG